jgi:hypothetical protein
VSSTTSGFQFVNPGNDVAGNVLPAETYFMHKASTYFKDHINPGFAAVVGEYVYSSSYDKGEFWSSPDVYPGTPLKDDHTNLHVYASGPNATLKYGAVGNALNARSIRVSVNGTQVQDTLMD